MSSYVTRKTPGNTEWFRKDRFGMFIHWGLYAMPARNERGDRRRDRDNRGNRGGRNFGGNRGGNRGGRGYDKKPYNRDRKPSSGSGATGGTTMKPSNDFFGIFLGNSNSDKKD